MLKTIKRCVCAMMAAALLAGGIPAPVSVQGTGLPAEAAGVTVSTRAEFLDALANKRSPITVADLVVIDNGAEESGQMRPVMIPANTVIQGSDNGIVVCRSPIQLAGDGVMFKDVKLHFESSDALGSVIHREIFLAGHILTLDHVDTYLEGSGSSQGGLGGSEKELLPTVYAGGYAGTAVGGNASLRVVNSDDKTRFQGIYMGHDKGNDNKVPYQAGAEVNLDAKAIVRDVVDTSRNSGAEICISGTGSSFAAARKFRGNENTTLTLDGVSMENSEANAVEVDNVGHIVLQNQSCLAPATDILRNVTLGEGTCLNLNGVRDAVIAGNFNGENDPAKDKGILVLNQEGSLTVQGNITGTTRFQTGSRLFPGVLLQKPYIFAAGGKGDASAFILAQKHIERGYELQYADNTWTVCGEPISFREIGRIEITSAPETVDLKRIAQKEEEMIPDEDIYFEITWYDEDGTPFSDEDIREEYWFFDSSYVLLIRSDYWESNDGSVQNETVWSQPVILLESEDHPGRYYPVAQEGYRPGDYTFLFCSRYIEEELDTVADVQSLRDIVMAECRVKFYDSDSERPDEHVHSYREVLNPAPACTKAGIMTYICSCGDTYTKEVAATGHRPVTDPAVSPTETANGKTEGSHCGVCGEIIKAQQTIPATGKPEAPGTSTDSGTSQPHKHSYRSVVTRASTCTQKGIRTYTCGCGHTYTEEIALVDHQYTREHIPATPESSGKQQQVCRVCALTRSATVIDSPREVILSKKDYSYDGKAKKPAVTVKDSKGKILKAGTDYQVSYPKGRKNPGVYTVTVKFQGNYGGRMTKDFTVKPRKTSLKKVTAKSKGMQVTWKKQTAQIDGYQIQYGTNKKFTGKTVKTTTAKKNAAVKTISKLKKKTRYYVRIRTYKTVKVDGKKKKLYSDWSGKKTVNIKK